MISLCLTLKCSIDSQIEKKKGLLALNHIFFCLICTTNLVTVILYWGTLHTKRMAEPDMTSVFLKFLVIGVHIYPFVFNWVNFAITDIVVKGSVGVIACPIGILYGYTNYYEVTYVRDGKPIYWWLTWESVPVGVAIFGALIVIGTGIFYVFEACQRSIKRKPS
jgi:hypothetical protein